MFYLSGHNGKTHSVAALAWYTPLALLVAACGSSAVQPTPTGPSAATTTGSTSTGGSTAGTTGSVAPAPLQVQVTSPGYVNKTSSLTLTGTASAGLGVEFIKVNGQAVVTNDGFATWSLSVTLAPAPNPTEPSTNHFTLTAADKGGSPIPDMDVVVLRYEDSTAPVVGKVFPAAPLLSDHPTITLRISVADNALVGGVSVDGLPANRDSASGDWLIDVTTPAGTTVAHQIVAKDIFDNEAAPYPASVTTSTPWFSQPTGFSSRGGRTFMWDSDRDRLLELSATGTFATLVTNWHEPDRSPDLGTMWDLAFTNSFGGVAATPRVVSASGCNACLVMGINPDTRQRFAIGSPIAGFIPLGIELSVSGATAYVVGQTNDLPSSSKVYELDLASGAATLLATLSQTGQSLKAWRARLDAANNRLFVSDYNHDYIVAVDLGPGHAVTNVVPFATGTSGIKGLHLTGSTLYYTRNDATLFKVDVSTPSFTKTEQNFTTGGALFVSPFDILPFGPTADDYAVFSYGIRTLVHLTHGAGDNWTVSNDWQDGHAGSGERFREILSIITTSVAFQPVVIVSDARVGLATVGMNGNRTPFTTNPAVSRLFPMCKGGSETSVFGVDNTGVLRQLDLSTSPVAAPALPNGSGQGLLKALIYTDGAFNDGAPTLVAAKEYQDPSLVLIDPTTGVQTAVPVSLPTGRYATRLAVGDNGEIFVGAMREVFRLTKQHELQKIETDAYDYGPLAWNTTTRRIVTITHGEYLEIDPGTGASTVMGERLSRDFPDGAISMIGDLYAIESPTLNAVTLFDPLTGDEFVLSR